MAEQIGTKLGNWLYQRGSIEKAQIDVVRYAFEILCSEFAELIIIITYGIGSGKWLETLMFICMLLILRKQFQGYHAKTILNCFLITMGAYLSTMILFPYINFQLGLVFLCISSLLELEYCIKCKAVKPFVVISILHILAGILYITISYAYALQILLIIELITAISLIPERRVNEE